MDETQKPVRRTNWLLEAPVGFIFSFIFGAAIMHWMPMPLPLALKVVVITGIVVTIFRLALKQSGALILKSLIVTFGFGCGVLLSSSLF